MKMTMNRTISRQPLGTPQSVPIRKVHFLLLQKKHFKWDQTSKQNAIKIFKGFIDSKKTPGKKHCESYIKDNNLDIPSWLVLKNMIKNEYYK